MPTMDFLLTVQDERIAAIHLSAVMRFPHPDDGKARCFWLLRQYQLLAADLYREAQLAGRPEVEASRAIGAMLGEMLLPLGGWGALAVATLGPAQKLTDHKEVIKRDSHGLLVGCMLSWLLHDGVTGLHTAAQLAIHNIAPKWGKSGLPRISTNAHNLKDRIWPKYRKSAHLWAANLTTDGKVILLFDKPGAYFNFHKYPVGGLRGFLAIAERLRWHGENKLPASGPQMSLLRPDETWKVPAGFPLPAPEDIIK